MGELVKDFSMQKFTGLLASRADQMDEEIYEILLSFSDFETFKAMMLDYRTAQEEEERYRILTIKTNKVPETKKVKSNTENIFANSQPLSLGGTDLTKKKSNPQKKK